MNDIINFKESSDKGVVINISDANSIISITVPSTELYSADTENTCAFKVNEDGKIIINCKTSEDNIKIVTTPIKEITKEQLLSNVDTKPKEESLLDIFEKIPEDLSKAEINKILEFVYGQELKEIGCSKILPYNVKLTDNGDLKITLVIYNGDKLQLNLPQIPLKLIDAKKSIIIAELVDINAQVNVGKIGIIETTVSKEKLKENTIDLKEWYITFAM